MSFFVFPCPLDVRHHLEVACLMSATVFLSPVVNLRVHLMFAYLVFFDFRVHSMSDITFGGVLDVRHPLHSMSATVVADALDVHLHLFGLSTVDVRLPFTHHGSTRCPTLHFRAFSMFDTPFGDGLDVCLHLLGFFFRDTTCSST